MFIEQSNGFILDHDGSSVCRLNKILYGLKQAPRAWHSKLDTCLKNMKCRKRNVDSNLYIKKDNQGQLILMVYVDDIIFVVEKETLCIAFVEQMKKRFEMFMLGKMKFFLGLHVLQSKAGIFLS